MMEEQEFTKKDLINAIILWLAAVIILAIGLLSWVVVGSHVLIFIACIIDRACADYPFPAWLFLVSTSFLIGIIWYFLRNTLNG